MTGIICASDPLALGAIRAARRAGLAVPGDLSVVGYDDSPLMACTDPPLTTVRQPIEAIGRAAVEMLVGQIEGSAVASGGALLRAGDRRARLDGDRRRRARRLRKSDAIRQKFASCRSSSCNR